MASDEFTRALASTREADLTVTGRKSGRKITIPEPARDVGWLPATQGLSLPRQALVKWWLLAIPQYGFGISDYGGWGTVGLIGVAAVIAAVVLLVTGRYPERIFDFVIGMSRWVLRVAGYAGLMTDKYPPFRLDMVATTPAR